MTTTSDLALDGAATRDWLLAFARSITDGNDELTELDRLAGDGDFGWNMATAVRRFEPGLRDETAGLDTSTLFGAVSDAFLTAGGTSGPLFGLWFGRIGAGPTGPWTTADLAAVVTAATAAVRRLGSAAPGDRTMVDAMVPAADALVAAADGPWDTALSAAAAAAADGAESTRAMVARRGRATYLGERAVGSIDPGAVAVAWFFAAAQEASR